MPGTYLQGVYSVFSGAFLLLALCHCNIEVGNPDSNLPEPSKAQDLVFNLSAGNPCVFTSSPCTSVPVLSGDPLQDPISFEISSADFYLASLELKPYLPESYDTKLDLLNGSQVKLTQGIDTTLVNEIAMGFAGSAGSATYKLTGSFVAQVNMQSIVIPVTLQVADAIVVSVVGSRDSGVIEAVVFNPNTWFDFRDSKQVVSHILKSITSGTCKDVNSLQCTRHLDSLSKQIGNRIEKSLSVKKNAKIQAK